MLFGKFVLDCVKSNLRGSKFKIFLGCMPPDPLVHTHTSPGMSVIMLVLVTFIVSCSTVLKIIKYNAVQHYKWTSMIGTNIYWKMRQGKVIDKHAWYIYHASVVALFPSKFEASMHLLELFYDPHNFMMTVCFRSTGILVVRKQSNRKCGQFY